MKAKTIFSAILALFLTGNAIAQNETEALRYSQMYWGGTARSTAVGGAFGAVGADFSSLSINPAGMGVYKKSEISFSPSLYYSKNINTYRGIESEDFKYSLNTGNFGMVFSAPITTVASDKPQWKSVQFGFGFNKIANFNNNIIIEGNNNETSLVDVIINKANGVAPSNLDPFDTQLAYDGYIINPDDVFNNTYKSDLQNADLIQRKSINTKGGMNEWAFSLSGNYNDMLYIGGTIGLVGLTYKEDNQYEEIDKQDTMSYFNSMTITDNLKTDGSGVNFKFGILAQPTNYLRFGAAIHTPTFFYRIEDNYTRNFTSDIDTMIYELDPVESVFKYELNTPLRVLGNIAFIINKSGFVSFDYEYVDYSTARLRSADYKFVDENNNVKNMYQATHNFRGGIEYTLKPFVLRAGYAHYMSPFKSDTLNNYQRDFISGGIGFRSTHYFIDFTYSHSNSDGKYYLYSGAVSDQKITSSNFVLSMGIKF
jgi:hypothetical protein